MFHHQQKCVTSPNDEQLDRISFRQSSKHGILSPLTSLKDGEIGGQCSVAEQDRRDDRSPE